MIWRGGSSMQAYPKSGMTLLSRSGILRIRLPISTLQFSFTNLRRWFSGTSAFRISCLCRRRSIFDRRLVPLEETQISTITYVLVENRTLFEEQQPNDTSRLFESGQAGTSACVVARGFDAVLGIFVWIADKSLERSGAAAVQILTAVRHLF
jgi:hypothetical protein